MVERPEEVKKYCAWYKAAYGWDPFDGVKCFQCGEMIPPVSVYRCYECQAPFHQACLIRHCEEGQAPKRMGSEIGSQVIWVPQEDEHGCGLASLAMICGRSYKCVKEWFLTQGVDIISKRGGTWWDWDFYLVEHGYAVSRMFRHVNREPRPIWPLKPFGPIHLCEVRPGGTNAHVVVMLSDGSVLDPYKLGFYSLSDYPLVESVAAVVKI